MELILTGERFSAQEALTWGLISKVTTAEELEPAALTTAKKIASFSKPAIQIAKEAVNASYESSLAEGVRFERRLFHATFGTDDRKEGMTAFEEKRPPKWNHR